MGPDESFNVVTRQEGVVPQFDSEPRDHVALAEMNGWVELFCPHLLCALAAVGVEAVNAARVVGAEHLVAVNDVSVMPDRRGRDESLHGCGGKGVPPIFSP